MLYRNYPRDFRYQIFSTKLPRGGNCFICRANTLVGLERLPSGGHIVAAPYVSASRDEHPRAVLARRSSPTRPESAGGLMSNGHQQPIARST